MSFVSIKKTLAFATDIEKKDDNSVTRRIILVSFLLFPFKVLVSTATSRSISLTASTVTYHYQMWYWMNAVSPFAFG